MGLRAALGVMAIGACLWVQPVAALSVFEVAYASQADLKVFEVDYASQAGWNGAPRGLGLR